MSIRRGPVRHGQTRVLAGHQSARDNDDQSGASDEYRDPMMPAIERRGHRPQAPSSDRVILTEPSTRRIVIPGEDARSLRPVKITRSEEGACGLCTRLSIAGI